MTRSLLTLVVALGLASLAVWAAQGLELDTGLEALLPNDSAAALLGEVTPALIAVNLLWLRAWCAPQPQKGI